MEGWYFKIIFICIQFTVITTYTTTERPVLLVVSYDAFRYNYFDKNVTPNLMRLKPLGTSATYLRNVFPTKTFPNHHSIATGLYPEVHGVIGNTVHDPVLGKLGYSYQLFHQNENIVPIWTLNQRTGQGRHSGSMMWPGANFPYQNVTPTFVQTYDFNMSWHERVDTALRWIRDPITPANLVMLYIEEPDTHAHAYGPESDTVVNMLKRLDELSQYLQDQLVEWKLVDRVNVIHLSDHGMESVSEANFINLTDYLQTTNTYGIYETSPVLHIVPKLGEDEQLIYDKLKEGTKMNGHFKVFRKDELPARWHLRDNSRTGPIVAVADVNYAFQDMYDSIEWYQKAYNITPTEKWQYGIHGYDNNNLSMLPFFMARGPLIKQNHVVEPFDTVDLYFLFCDILNLIPEKINGSLTGVQDILKEKTNDVFSPMVIALGGAILSFFIIASVALIVLFMIRRKQVASNLQENGSRINEDPEARGEPLRPEEQRLLSTETASDSVTDDA